MPSIIDSLPYLAVYYLSDLTSDLYLSIFTTYSKPVENYYQCTRKCITPTYIGRLTLKYYASVRRSVKVY